MLIAIMGNTYDKVSDSQSVAQMLERIEILSEYRDVIGFYNPTFRYFFIIRPASVTDDNTNPNEEWEGRIAAIKKAVNQSIQRMGTEVNSNVQNFETQLAKMADKNKIDVTNIIEHDVTMQRFLLLIMARVLPWRRRYVVGA